MPWKEFEKKDLQNMVFGKTRKLSMVRIIKKGLTAKAIFKDESTGKHYEWDEGLELLRHGVKSIRCREMELRETKVIKWLPVPNEEKEKS
jgi:hypothetical protein